MKTHKLILVLIPAILIAILALFIRFIQYEPLVPQELIDKGQGNNQANGIQIPIYPDDPILGNKKAPITLIAFEDFGCEHCSVLSSVFDQLLEAYPDKVKIIWKGLSVAKFPYSTEAAHQYAFCANRQGKFAEFSKFAFANYNQLTKTTLDAISANIKLNEKKLLECLTDAEMMEYNTKNEMLGMALNIQAVPTVFLNNKQISPPADLTGWQAVLGL